MTPRLAAAARRAAARFGTPLFLYDLATLDADAERIEHAFPDPWLHLYALKANGLTTLAGRLAERGFGASAVSGGELSLADRAGFDPARTTLEGIGKTPPDLAAAVGLAAEGRPLLWVSLESADEAGELAGLARRAGCRIDVLVRVNPQVRPETQAGLAVGAVESKFGVLAEELPAVVAAGGGADGPLRWRGLHVHVGSQLGAVDAWRAAFRVGLATLGLQRGGLPDFDTLDAGSGFPVAARPGGAPDAEHFGRAAREALDELPPDARPRRLAIEPGRVLVARCGWLLARVLHVRPREPRRVVLDAGMTELIRPALYGAEHPIVALESLGDAVDGTVGTVGTEPAQVDGPVCESTDRLGEADLPPLQRGDLIAIGLAGAYGSAMSSRYNGRPRAAEAVLDPDANQARLIRRRERRACLP